MSLDNSFTYVLGQCHILRITNRCNLRCKGCHAQAILGDVPDGLSVGRLRSTATEIDDQGGCTPWKNGEAVESLLDRATG